MNKNLIVKDLIEFAQQVVVDYASETSKFSSSRKKLKIAFFPLRFVVEQGNDVQVFTDADRAIEWYERI